MEWKQYLNKAVIGGKKQGAQIEKPKPKTL